MKYKQYTLDDFLMDAYFRKWVLEADASTITFWETWVKDNPDKKPIVAEAREIILSVELDEIQFPEEKGITMWERVTMAIQDDTSGKAPFEEVL